MLTDDEVETLTAVVDCLIPGDALGPSASEAGVVEFILKQLSGGYGAGTGMYVAGDAGQPISGGDVFLTPLETYRVGLPALDRLAVSTAGQRFVGLGVDDRIRMLEGVDGSGYGSSAKAFFDQVLENTMEGYFSDPIHGGNRSATGWKMIGFPGCGHDYRSHVGKNAPIAHLVSVQSIATLRQQADAQSSEV